MNEATVMVEKSCIIAASDVETHDQFLMRLAVRLRLADVHPLRVVELEELYLDVLSDPLTCLDVSQRAYLGIYNRYCLGIDPLEAYGFKKEPRS
jgi:hypothetical protein